MSFEKFWPSNKNIDQVVGTTQADGLTAPIVVAAHNPMRVMRNFKEGSAATTNECAEKDILAWLTSPVATAGGTHIVPIAGPSGSGKSHLIVWLEAQLRREPYCQKYHIIRIRKNASFKQIVLEIIDSLPDGGGAALSELREKVEDAQNIIDPNDALFQFDALVRARLDRRFKKLAADLESESTTKKQMELQGVQWASDLISDSVLQRHWFMREAQGARPAGAVRRIVTRALKGGFSEDGEAENLFHLSDLEFSEFERFRDTAMPAQVAMADIRGQDEFQTIVLNEFNQIVPGCVGDLLKIGGSELEGLFGEVRKSVKDSGRELVLLVEDLVRLSAVKAPVMNVLEEAEITEEREHWCTVRAAIALTDGYLQKHDTFEGRANLHFSIGAHQCADEQIVALVAGWLNACRWGRDAIHAQYEQYEDSDGDQWSMPVYSAADLEDAPDDFIERFEPFGREESREIPLFPFNREAILTLVRSSQGIQAGEPIEYKPRAILKTVFDYVLKAGRGDFEGQRFPSQGFAFGDARRLAPIVQYTIEQEAPRVDCPRLKTLTYFWGAAPESVASAAQVHPSIFVAFGLKTPFPAHGGTAPPPGPTPPGPTPPGPTPPGPTPPGPTPPGPIPPGPIPPGPIPPEPEPWERKVNEWNAHISEWQAGGALKRSVESFLRTELANEIKFHLRDGEGFAFKNLNWPQNNPFHRTRFGISNAQSEAPFHVVRPFKELGLETQFYLGIQGLIRFHKNGKNWQEKGMYPVYWPAYREMVSTLAEHFRAFLEEQGRTKVKQVFPFLLLGARLAGIKDSDSDDTKLQFRAALTAEIKNPFKGEGTPLALVATKLIDRKRAELRTDLLGGFTLRQGSSGAPFGFHPEVMNILDAECDFDILPRASIGTGFTEVDRFIEDPDDFGREIDRAWEHAGTLAAAIRSEFPLDTRDNLTTETLRSALETVVQVKSDFTGTTRLTAAVLAELTEVQRLGDLLKGMEVYETTDMGLVSKVVYLGRYRKSVRILTQLIQAAREDMKFVRERMESERPEGEDDQTDQILAGARQHLENHLEDVNDFLHSVTGERMDLSQALQSGSENPETVNVQPEPGVTEVDEGPAETVFTGQGFIADCDALPVAHQQHQALMAGNVVVDGMERRWTQLKDNLATVTLGGLQSIYELDEQSGRTQELNNLMATENSQVVASTFSAYGDSLRSYISQFGVINPLLGDTNHYREYKSSLTVFGTAIEGQRTLLWGEYCRGQKTPTDETVLAEAENDPDSSEDVATIRRLIRDLADIESREPASEADFGLARRNFKDLREAYNRVVENAGWSEEVYAFMTGVREGGVALGDIPEEVHDWLGETGRMDDFVVTKRGN